MTKIVHFQRLLNVYFRKTHATGSTGPTFPVLTEFLIFLETNNYRVPINYQAIRTGNQQHCYDVFSLKTAIHLWESRVTQPQFHSNQQALLGFAHVYLIVRLKYHEPTVSLSISSSSAGNRQCKEMCRCLRI